MYKQLTKLTMPQLPAGALTMTFVIYRMFVLTKGPNSYEGIDQI